MTITEDDYDLFGRFEGIAPIIRTSFYKGLKGTVIVY